MSLALEILEQRKQAGLGTFADNAYDSIFTQKPGRSNLGSFMQNAYNSVFKQKPDTYYLTNLGRMEQRAKKGPPAQLLPSMGGVKLPERMAPEPFPQHIVDAHQKSQAMTKQVQDLNRRLQAGPAAPAPEPTQAELNARHAATVSSLKQVEASRTAPKMPVAPDPNWPPKAAPAGSRKMFPSLGKTACFDCPALEVLRLRAA